MAALRQDLPSPPGRILTQRRLLPRIVTLGLRGTNRLSIEPLQSIQRGRAFVRLPYGDAGGGARRLYALAVLAPV
jgi:hypothetical protein